MRVTRYTAAALAGVCACTATATYGQDGPLIIELSDTVPANASAVVSSDFVGLAVESSSLPPYAGEESRGKS